MEVSDKVCIITGSAQGIGKAYAAKLLENGAKICLADLNENTGNTTLKEFQETFGTDHVCFKRCDVTVEDDFSNLFDFAENFFNVKGIDMLVNNAGISENYGLHFFFQFLFSYSLCLKVKRT